MSRKKLKAFDPANTNKSQREAYLKLQEGPNIRDLAPKHLKDENRLSGAARRFAMQMIVSKKLDERDRDRQSKKEGKHAPNGKQADYRVKLNEQIAAAAKAKQEQINRTLAKAERKAQKQQLAKQGLTDGPNNSNSAPSTPSSSTITSLSASNRTVPSSSTAPPSKNGNNGAVSLSKSVEEQRQARKERAANEMSQAEKKTLAAAKAAEEAAAAAEEEARAAAAAESGEAAAPQKVAFNTEMRPGESFRSYQARLVQEKRAMMEAEVTATKKGLSERKKRKLAEKEEKRKAKRDPNAMDADERRVLAERTEKERKDAAIAAAKESKKGGKKTNHDDDDDGYDSPVAASASSSHRAREFANNESVAFGDIVDRPPTLTKLPKSKTLAGKVQHDRIIDGLLLMQQKKNSKKKKNKGGDGEEDDAELQELEKAEWIAKQMDQARRERLAQEQKEKSLASLREASIAAYKASKKRKREEEALPAADPNSAKKEAYVPKRILKKQKRNRERMKQFKDNAEMDLDLEIEMADNFD